MSNSQQPMERNSFMRASYIKNHTPGKEDANRQQDADAMMAEIQKGIKFFNDENDEESPLKHDESMLQHHVGNMSFSFAVEAPIEMEQKQKLIGQGWKKKADEAAVPQNPNKRQAKQKEKSA